VIQIKITRYFYGYFKSEKFKITELIKDNGSKGVWIVPPRKKDFTVINFMLYQKDLFAESSVNKDQSLQVMLPNKEVVVDRRINLDKVSRTKKHRQSSQQRLSIIRSYP
jgi:hypothetical protein